MFRAFLVLAAVFAATVCQAAAVEEITIYKINTPGYYVVQAGKIVPFGQQPDDPVVPPPVNDLTKAVVAEVNKIAATDARHAAALKLSKTYEMLAAQKLPPAKAVEATNTIVNLALGTADAKAFSGVTTIVNTALGKCTTEAAVSAVLTEAGEAVGSTVPASGDEAATAAKYGIDWSVFLAFLMELLKVLLPIILSL